jgi:hypothetical protein
VPAKCSGIAAAGKPLDAACLSTHAAGAGVSSSVASRLPVVRGQQLLRSASL